MSSARKKTARVLAALSHQEADRVPIGEFFWTNFIRRCKEELDVGDDFDPYRYWDLDLIVINPNMDPQLTGIEVLEADGEHKLVRTGYGATIERKRTYPMPHFVSFATETYEQMEALGFDDPHDRRRYYDALDDQINGVADELNLGLPAYADRVNAYADDFCVFGSVCEVQEQLWRIIGPENVYYKLAEDPDRLEKFIRRLGDFLEVMRKLGAARGGGYIVQSDHSIPSNVDPHTYDFVVQLVREYGRYPLDLAQYDPAPDPHAGADA